MIVLTDRYPQIQNYGFNDGPLIGNFIHSQNFFEKNAAKLELKLYKYSSIVYPDIVIKLIGDSEVLYNRRKNDMSHDLINMKQNVIKDLSFSENSKVFEIDATLDKFEIKKKILNIIGECISIK